MDNLKYLTQVGPDDPSLDIAEFNAALEEGNIEEMTRIAEQNKSLNIHIYNKQMEDIAVVKREVYRDLRRQTGLEDSELANTISKLIDYFKQEEISISEVVNKNKARVYDIKHYQKPQAK